MSGNVDDRVMLIGKLGSDPELKPVANGKMLTLNLGVQVVSCNRGETGLRQSTERTSWHRVISFDPGVIRCAQGLETDDTMVVRGYLDQRTYEKDGRDLFISEFVAEELDPLSTKHMPSAIPSPPPVGRRSARDADMLRITVELLPGGRESGALVISRGALPISNLADLAKSGGGRGE